MIVPVYVASVNLYQFPGFTEYSQEKEENQDPSQTTRLVGGNLSTSESVSSKGEESCSKETQEKKCIGQSCHEAQTNKSG